MTKNDFALTASLLMITIPVAIYLSFYLLSKIIDFSFKTSLYFKTLEKKSFKDWLSFMKRPLPPVYTGHKSPIHKKSIRNVNRKLPPTNSDLKNVHKDKEA